MQDCMLHCDNQGPAIAWSRKATLSEPADVEANSLVVIGLVYADGVSIPHRLPESTYTPAEAKALPCQEAMALVDVDACMHGGSTKCCTRSVLWW